MNSAESESWAARPWTGLLNYETSKYFDGHARGSLRYDEAMEAYAKAAKSVRHGRWANREYRRA